MSYILDALKRAERERKQGQVSVLDEIPTAPVTGEPRRRLLLQARTVTGLPDRGHQHLQVGDHRRLLLDGRSQRQRPVKPTRRFWRQCQCATPFEFFWEKWRAPVLAPLRRSPV